MSTKVEKNSKVSKPPVTDLADMAEKAMENYLEAVDASGCPHSLKPHFRISVAGLFHYEMDNIFDYMDTAAHVLSALTDPQVSGPLFEAIRSPYREKLPEMLERIIFFCHEVASSDPAKAILHADLGLDYAYTEENRETFERIRIEYEHRTELINKLKNQL